MKDVAEKLIVASKEAASVLGLNGCHEAQDRAREVIAEAEAFRKVNFRWVGE